MRCTSGTPATAPRSRAGGSGTQSYISKGIWRQDISSFVRNSCVSTLCPVVVYHYLCTSEEPDGRREGLGPRQGCRHVAAAERLAHPVGRPGAFFCLFSLSLYTHIYIYMYVSIFMISIYRSLYLSIRLSLSLYIYIYIRKCK